jgi:hypothetical protein
MSQNRQLMRFHDRFAFGVAKGRDRMIHEHSQRVDRKMALIPVGPHDA